MTGSGLRALCPRRSTGMSAWVASLRAVSTKHESNQEHLLVMIHDEAKIKHALGKDFELYLNALK